MELEDEDLFCELRDWPFWPQLEALFQKRLNLLWNGLLIPLHEAAGQGQGTYVSASSFVQGQIRELQTFVALVKEAERPKVGESEKKKP